jgi:hypothetical protein
LTGSLDRKHNKAGCPGKMKYLSGKRILPEVSFWVLTKNVICGWWLGEKSGLKGDIGLQKNLKNRFFV